MADEENSGQSYLYDAFISYRHVERDRKWAEWLIDALERYRVPKALQERGVPPRIRKIFRDEDEVPASSDLNDQIKEALKASRFLIVVCSAFTPRSKWVEREIEIFNELGRDDRVLALLTEGEPGDSFPSAMLVRQRRIVEPDGSTRIVKEEKEPLAADVRPRKGVSAEKLKRFALLRLIAVILGVRFDDLRQREHERERGRVVRRVAAAAALLVLSAGLGGSFWYTLRPATTHYRQIVWRWGVPQGLGPIDEDTREHLATSYGVTMQRRSIMGSPRVTEVRRENSAGKLRDTDSMRIDNDGRARWVIRYRDDNSVDRIEGFDATDRLLSEDVIRREGNRFIVTFERNNIPVARDAHANRIIDPLNAAERNVLEGRTQITRYVLTFDANGFVAECRYQDNWGTAQHDAEGSFGEHFTNSPEGLVLRSAEIDTDGAEITLKNGVRAAALSYDQNYNLVRYSLIGTDERPIDGPNGFAYYIRQSDSWGNDVATAYYHPDGQAALSKGGYTKYATTYDQRGFPIELAFIGLDGKPTLSGDGYAGLRRINDDRGNAIEETYVATDGSLTFRKNGYAELRRSYDQRSRVVEETYFDADGKPTLIKDGYAGLRRSFDPRGNIVQLSYFGTGGQPTLLKQGYSTLRHAYDDRDHSIEEAYFGVDGRPTLNRRGIAVSKLSYDPRGNLIAIADFGIDGKPALDINVGFSRLALVYDEHGNLIEVNFFGVDGEPILQRESIAGFRQAFDERGNRIAFAVFGADGKPKLNNENIAKFRYRFDTRGRETERAFFDVDGKPTLGASGFARSDSVYDERGNKIELAYFGIDGKPTLNKERIAKIRYTYDAHGNEIRRAFFGVDGRPTLASTGIAGFRQEFDDRGYKVEQVSLGIDGKPAPNSEGIAKFRYTYDMRGKETERAFFDIDDSPTLGAAGFARAVWAYDARGNAIEASYFGVEAKPVMLPNSGYSKVRWAYDARDKIIEESYFAVDGTPVGGSGCARIMYAYDDLGREIRVTCIDALSQEMPIEIAISRVSPGFAGARSGLAPGDRLLTYHGEKVTSIRRYYDLVSEPGQLFRILTLRRGSEMLTVPVPSGSLGIDIAVVPVGAAEVDAAKLSNH